MRLLGTVLSTSSDFASAAGAVPRPSSLGGRISVELSGLGLRVGCFEDLAARARGSS